MGFSIISKAGEKTFLDKEVVNISSRDGYDYKLDVDFDFMLTIQYKFVPFSFWFMKGLRKLKITI